MDWLVDLDKGHFNGRRALLKQKAEGIKRCLVGANNSHTKDLGKSAEALLTIVVSMRLSCAMSLLI